MRSRGAARSLADLLIASAHWVCDVHRARTAANGPAAALHGRQPEWGLCVCCMLCVCALARSEEGVEEEKKRRKRRRCQKSDTRTRCRGPSILPSHQCRIDTEPASRQTPANARRWYDPKQERVPSQALVVVVVSETCRVALSTKGFGQDAGCHCWLNRWTESQSWVPVKK